MRLSFGCAFLNPEELLDFERMVLLILEAICGAPETERFGKTISLCFQPNTVPSCPNRYFSVSVIFSGLNSSCGECLIPSGFSEKCFAGIMAYRVAQLVMVMTQGSRCLHLANDIGEPKAIQHGAVLLYDLTREM
jgi:hypothetical protein